MFDLPYNTYRFLIEPITRSDHLKIIMYRRYIKFILSLSKSSKPIVRTLFDVCKDSTLSTTGQNLRSLRLMTGSTDDIAINHASKIEYHQMTDDDAWRMEVIEDLLDKADQRKFDEDEKELLNFACYL